MAISVFSNERPELGTRFLSVDQQARIYFSRDAQRLIDGGNEPFPYVRGLDFESALQRLPDYPSVRIYLGYDAINKRIGVASTDDVTLVGTSPFKLSRKRSYTTCRTFLSRNGIEAKDGKADRYLYVGKDAGWHLFQKEGYDAPEGVPDPASPLPEDSE